MSPLRREELRRFLAELRPRWRVRETLGRGAMGAVFLCEDTELRRDVAVKLLLLEADPEVTERFRREARALAAIEHPNVVRVFDHDVLPRGPYLVMEHLRGRPLSDRPACDPVAVMLQVADGLQAAHDAGLVHRDVKPANLFLTDEGRAVVLDFGLVARPEDGAGLTATQAVIGTPLYLAPERLAGEPATPAADWWAWGLTLYELLEGRRLLEEKDLYVMLSGRPAPEPRFERTDPGSAMAGAIRACLAEDPRDRPAGAAALRARLAGGRRATAAPAPPGRATPRGSSSLMASPASRPRPRPAPGPRVALPVGLGVLLVGGLAWIRPSPPARPPPEPAPPRSPFPPSWEGDLRRELARPADPLARRDPAAFPALARWSGWLAGGGQPGSLPSRVLDLLAELDADLRGRGRPALFAPVLPPYDSPAPVPFPPGIATVLGFASLPSPAATSGAASRALAALDRALGFRAEVVRSLEDAVLARWPPGHPVVRILRADAALDDPGEVAAAFFAATTERAVLGEWMAPGIEATQRALYLTGEALRAGNPDGPVVVAAVGQALPFLDPFLFSHLLGATVPELVGVLPESAHAGFLRARLASRHRALRHRLGLAAPVDMAERGWILAALARDRGGPFEDTRVATALYLLVRLARETGHPGDLRRAFETLRSLLDEVSPAYLREVLVDLVEVAGEEPDALPLDPSEAAWAVATLRTMARDPACSPRRRAAALAAAAALQARPR